MVNKIRAIEIKDFIGKKFFTRWSKVTQEEINKFADITKDHQFIHVNPERAKLSIYGKTVAHGFYVLSMLGFFTLQNGDTDSMQFYITDAKTIINYGFDKIRFISPVPVGSLIRDVSFISKVELVKSGMKFTSNHTIEIKGQEKPAVIADWINLLIL
ncbi:MAG TPA: MaoC family dehydratase [archaeon]|nr:MaoC family dehydratase [archaeon]